MPDDIDRLSVLHEARRLAPNTGIEIHVLNKKDAEIFKQLKGMYRDSLKRGKNYIAMVTW